MFLVLKLAPALIALFLCGTLNAANAATNVQLFFNSQPSPRYFDLVRGVHFPSTLHFSNEVSYQVVGKLGAGSKDFIFETDQGQALRVTQYPKSTSVDSFYLGIKELEASNIKTPKILDYSENEFVLIEKIDVQFTLAELLEGELKQRINHREVIKKLVEFAHTISNFRVIGDFHFSQVVFNGKEWLILDTTTGHHLVGPETIVGQDSPWQGFSFDFYARKSKKGPDFVYAIREKVLKTVPRLVCSEALR